MPWKAKKTKSGAVVKNKNNKTVSTHTSMKKLKAQSKQGTQTIKNDRTRN